MSSKGTLQPWPAWKPSRCLHCPPVMSPIELSQTYVHGSNSLLSRFVAPTATVLSLCHNRMFVKNQFGPQTF